VRFPESTNYRYLDFLKHEHPDLPLILEHLSVDQLPAALQQLQLAAAARV